MGLGAPLAKQIIKILLDDGHRPLGFGVQDMLRRSSGDARAVTGDKMGWVDGKEGKRGRISDGGKKEVGTVVEELMPFCLIELRIGVGERGCVQLETTGLEVWEGKHVIEVMGRR